MRRTRRRRRRRMILKGAIGVVFLTIAPLHRELLPTRIVRLKWPGPQSCANVQHVGRLSRATSHVSRARKGQLNF